MCRFKPVEVLIPFTITQECIILLKNSSSKPIFSKSKVHFPSIDEMFQAFDQFFINDNKPEFFNELYNRKDNKFLNGIKSLYMGLNYLKEILLEETVFKMGNFEFYDLKSNENPSMFLDSQVLLNLEINEIAYSSKYFKNLTLMQFMDKTKTAYGKRMLEKWILEPLLYIPKINERLDAIDDLISKPEISEYFQREVSKLPDLERKIARICNFANMRRLSADYFETDYLNNRLKEFIGLLAEIKKIGEIIPVFEEYLPGLKSKRLRQLLKFYDINNEQMIDPDTGLMPNMKEIIEEIEKMVVFVDGYPCPAPGFDQEYDAILLQVNIIIFFILIFFFIS